MITQSKILLLLIASVLSTNLVAHQQKEAFSSLLFNPRSGNLEVSHRFYLHDAEHAISKISGKNADLNADKPSQQFFAEYVASEFQLRDANLQPIALTYVGFEVEGKYLWIYQEAPITQSMSGFAIKMSALQEVWSQQLNYVNVEKNKQVFSIRIESGDGWKQLEIK